MTHVALNRLELKNLELKNGDTARNKRYIRAQEWKPSVQSLVNRSRAKIILQGKFMIKTDITKLESTSFVFWPNKKYLKLNIFAIME